MPTRELTGLRLHLSDQEERAIRQLKILGFD
jgi:hypothetical protein